MLARSPGNAIANAVPMRTQEGVARMYNAANLISRPPSFFPRYSGVRPIIRPATNTAMIARTRMPYNPEPVPPGAISPNPMSTIVTMPPIDV